MTDRRPVLRALLSVSDKSGLIPFAEALQRHGAELISTGGTAEAIRNAGLPVRDVSDITGMAEMMDGRVKTLHPAVHGALLARRDLPAHMEALAAIGKPIDLLVVNLYPFEETLASGAGYDDCVEKIDIGGPAMLRSAAKNHDAVAVVTDPQDYDGVIGELAEGGTTVAFRRNLAQIAFARTAAYDSAISNWLAGEIDVQTPRRVAVAGELVQTLRYGENPHQKAAFYRSGPARPGVSTARQIQGKELSYNNIADTDAAFELVAEFDPEEAPAVAIIKHANPCGVATGTSLADAYRRAREGDPVSAFGGIVALNRPLDRETASAIAEIFTEVVIAPGISADAAEVLAAKSALRLLVTDRLPQPSQSYRRITQVAGGFLVQDKDAGQLDESMLTTVTKRAPTAEELRDLLFAWRVAKHVKSNAIVYANGGRTVGIGAGQMSRVDSTRIAARKAEDMMFAQNLDESPARGSAVASDAFFPFADGLITASEAGASAVIQPGGSVRDQEVIDAANARGIAMVFTGMRHFRH